MFEPLPKNIERLKKNLSPFEGRYCLEEHAIALVEGQAAFGWEETGRYGGIGRQTGNNIQVACKDSNQVLENILKKHSKIDILKIDIETLEKEVTERIPFDIAKRIERIYVEHKFKINPLKNTHHCRQYGNVAQFINNAM